MAMGTECKMICWLVLLFMCILTNPARGINATTAAGAS
jgi:hypothetical protein